MHKNIIAERIARMEELGSEIQHIAIVHDGTSAGRLVKLRRLYSEAIQEMAAAAEAGLSSLPAEAAGPLNATFRKMLNDARAAVADHQARWPAVTIAHDSFTYAASSRRVSDQLQALVGWVKASLLPALAR
jgi:hypothetical protein